MINHLTAVEAPSPDHRPADAARLGEPAGQPGGISLTDRYMTRDGEPWFPVMGEYHFSRDAAGRWETELLKMKAGGITVVATYLLWIVHEERQGTLRWDGDRDIRRFLELARSHGLFVMLRIGPWAHGETRNGGFPDWLQSSGVPLRSNAPEYQALVERWYSAVAGQVAEFCRTEGMPQNPIIGVQVDNELYDQPDHLAWLRTSAEAAGIVAPVWTATGWGGALLPPDLVPIYAGYSDAFWEESDVRWPGFAHTHFEFSGVRDDLTVGADVRTSELVQRDQDERYPWVTCELGGGMATAYHRRPIVTPDDVASLALVKLGSGSAWQGYYLYHGGIHVAGEDTTTQESHATGYPNDMPVRDYDFYAPIGAHGQLREHYHLLRRQHLFIQQYGRALLTSATVIAPLQEDGPRWSFRGEREGGHVFVNNHQPSAAPLPDLPDVQLRIHLAEGGVTLPSTPFVLSRSAYFVWPVRRPFGSLTSVSATVQPVTELDSGQGHVVVFAAIADVPVEFLLEGVAPGQIEGARILSSEDGRTLITIEEPPGTGCTVVIGDTTLVVLDAHTANRLWRGEVGGVDTLAIWDEGLLFDRGSLRLLTSRPSQLLHTCPPLPAHVALAEAGQRSSVFRSYTITGPEEPHGDVLTTIVQEPTGPVPVRTGGSAGRLSAPQDEDFTRAGVIDVVVPRAESDDDVLLSVRWTGDVARAEIDGSLVSDQFWYGREWDVALPPRAAEETSVRLRILPSDPGTGVFVEPAVRPQFGRPEVHIHDVHLVRTRTVAVSS